MCLFGNLPKFGVDCSFQGASRLCAERRPGDSPDFIVLLTLAFCFISGMPRLWRVECIAYFLRAYFRRMPKSFVPPAS